MMVIRRKEQRHKMMRLAAFTEWVGAQGISYLNKEI